MNGGSPDHLTLSEMLDALESRVGALLYTNQRLAARLQESADALSGEESWGVDPIETEDMKSKKSSEGQGFGLLFPELDPDPVPQESLFPEDDSPKVIGEEGLDNVAAEAGDTPSKRKRTAKPKKPATEPVSAAPSPVVDDSQVPEAVPDWVTEDFGAEPDQAVAASDVAGAPVEAAPVENAAPAVDVPEGQAPVGTASPKADAAAVDAELVEAAPVTVAAARGGVSEMEEPVGTALPKVDAAAVDAELVETVPVDVAAAAVDVPELEELVENGDEVATPVATAVEVDPEPVKTVPVEAASSAVDVPEMKEPVAAEAVAAELVEAAPVVPATSTIDVKQLDEPVESAPFKADTAAVAIARPETGPASTPEPWTPRPHPFVELAGASPRTATAQAVPVVRQEVVEKAAPRPVLVPAAPAAPANGSRRRHPFAEFGAVAARPASTNPSPSSASDVHWSFPAEQESNRRPETLRRHMDQAGLTPDELAGALGVSAAALNGWLSGSIAVPAWVLSSVSVLELVKPSARIPVRKTVSSQPGYRHPFARIEDL